MKNLINLATKDKVTFNLFILSIFILILTGSISRSDRIVSSGRKCWSVLFIYAGDVLKEYISFVYIRGKLEPFCLNPVVTRTNESSRLQEGTF